jgi:hypothetical protein
VGWGDLVVGLRPAACWTKGGDCQSFCLRWYNEIGEGIERRVASSPSPQQGPKHSKYGPILIFWTLFYSFLLDMLLGSRQWQFAMEPVQRKLLCASKIVGM